MRSIIRRHTRNVALLLTGVLVGVLLVGPAGAHVGTSISHLWGAPNHLKKKVQNLGDKRWAKKTHNHNATYYGFGTTLPKGKTLAGGWFGSEHSDVITNFGATISFPVPLGFNPNIVWITSGDVVPDTCGGTVSAPKADPGYLCVYAGPATNVASGGTPGTFAAENPTAVCDHTSLTPLCRLGVIVWPTQFAAGYSELGGTYAVRAPV
jgi:hypothetical protein